MPTANELLSTEACDDILVVDLESRKIIIPKNVSVLGVEADDETRILHFHIPRHYCDVDLSEFSIQVHYRNANGKPDMYIVTKPTIEDELIKFDWIVGRHAFAKKGDVTFSVCLKDLFEGIVRREFNTTIATLPVLEGLETGNEIVNEHLDIFEQLREAVNPNNGSSGFPNLGENITEGYANDTITFWADKGSGQAWFSANDMLVNQPCQYGFVISYVHGTDVFQMFSDQNDGVTYFRYGDGINNWFKHWTALELPGMATTTELGLVMVNGNNGIGVNTENGNLFIKQASNSEIDGKEHSYKPITPENLDYAVKAALTNNANDLSDSERTSVLDWIGAISKLCVQKESGNITDLLGTESCRYIIGSDVTGMPSDDKWWFVDVLSNGYTDLIAIAISITSTPVQYVRTCVNDEWGSWHKVPTFNADGILITESNIEAHYLQGEWLQTTADTHLTEAAEKIAVLDDEGWVYHRTASELRSDMDVYSKAEVDAAIAAAIAKLG